MFAVVSDIHANREAFSSVLRAIKRLRATRIICLGDIVGYGPDPEWCVDTVLSKCDVVVSGNHDFALIYGRKDFTKIADSSIAYHRQILMPGSSISGDGRAKRERWQQLKALGHRHVEDGLLFVHASPRNPVHEYLKQGDVRYGLTDKLSANFELVQWVALIGHTHRPGVITDDYRFVTPSQCDGVYRALPGRKAIVNVGSVGQPRDGDTRACFVTVDGPEFRYHRVKYDLEATASKIEMSGRLDVQLAERLRQAR